MNNLHVQKTPFVEERNSKELGILVGMFTSLVNENLSIGGSLEFIIDQSAESELSMLVSKWKNKFERKSIEKQIFYIQKFYEVIFGIRVAKSDIQTYKIRDDMEFFFAPPALTLKPELLVQKTERFFGKEFFSFSIPEDIQEISYGRNGRIAGHTFAHHATDLPDADYIGKSYKRFSAEKKNKYMSAYEMMLWLAFRHWMHGKPKGNMGTTITSTPIGKNKVVAVTYEDPTYVFKAIDQVRPLKKKSVTDVGPRLVMLKG